MHEMGYKLRDEDLFARIDWISTGENALLFGEYFAES